MAASMKHAIHRNVCSLCKYSQISFRKISQAVRKAHYSATIVPKETSIDPVAMELMEDEKLTFKTHPGIMRLKTVKIPQRLEMAVQNIIEKYPVSNMQKRAKAFQNYLHGRHAPIEQDELRHRAKEIEEKMESTSEAVLSSLSEDEVEKLDNAKKEKLFHKLRATIYKWKPTSFDAHGALLYMVSRLPQDYSIILKCLSEIYFRDPDFKPKALLDFGSGVGSVIWAANEVWRSRIVEYLCMDKSVDISTLARLLLQDGEEQKDMHIPGVYFRQFLPSTQENTFDIVVSCYTLLEQPSRQERLDMVLSLWRMTDDYLVLVENGSIPGFRLIDEARAHILQCASENNDESLEGHVFAPCPHDFPCPKLTEKKSPCFFNVHYRPLKLLTKGDIKVSERYSYVILKKGRRTETSGWPRVVQEVTKASKHIHCHLCCPSGNLHHEILTQKRNGKDMYQCVRYTSWGDLFPVRLSALEPEETSEEDTSLEQSHDSDKEFTTDSHNMDDESSSTDTNSSSRKPLPA